MSHPSNRRAVTWPLALLLLLPCTAALRPAGAETPPPEVETACGYTDGEDVGIHFATHAFTLGAQVGGGVGSGADTHRYWLKFDLGFLPADTDEVLSATLTLMSGRSSKLTIGVARGEDDWSAATIDWATQPAFGAPLGMVEYVFVAEEQYSWDVTTHVADEVAGGDGQLSLVLLQVPEGLSPANPWFYTDTTATSDAHRPTLCVTYTRRVTNTPPVVTVGDPLVLWPPNHDMESLDVASLASAEDAEDGALDLASRARILSVRSDEPADAPGGGDGQTAVDIEITGPTTSFQVRRERDGCGNGRVYVVRFEVEDSAGATTEAEARIEVPASQGDGSAVDDGADAGHTVVAGS